MTAKDYLRQKLGDSDVKVSDPETRIALCAYAMRIQCEVEGYSIDDAEEIIFEYGFDKVFSDECIRFISDAGEAYEYRNRIPQLED